MKLRDAARGSEHLTFERRKFATAFVASPRWILGHLRADLADELHPLGKDVRLSWPLVTGRMLVTWRMGLSGGKSPATANFSRSSTAVVSPSSSDSL